MKTMDHEEKIFVSVRLRPLNGKEIARNDVSDWECINESTIVYKNANLSVPDRSIYPSAYTFDRVFRCDSSTRRVYEEGAKEVALSVVSGINSSVFAYGQTSSGKTYTMTGITQYTIADIYDYIQKHLEREFLLKFSAMEIYNESVRDLLSTDSTPLRLLDDPERGTVVEKLTEEILRDWNHVLDLLSICEAQRQIGETSLNETSSRSHQIIRLTIESAARGFVSMDNSSTLVAAVNFVDLAGSERASQSLSAGTRLKEGCHINRSLLTLGTVIRKLSKGRNGHVPFRDSKLTRILQSSLGGNARTAIICTMSPARRHVEQSRNTLLFASCAKEVSTNAQINVIMSDKALVKHLQRELARLESELNPGFVTSNYAALLQEKDLQIEKMEKEIKDLTLQRDSAKSQVQDLLRLVGDEGNSLIRVGLGHYPNLRVRGLSESEISVPETFISADPRSPNIDVRTFGTGQYSDGHSSDGSDDHYVQHPEFEEKVRHNNRSPRILISTSHFSESDSCQGWEDIDEHSTGTSEDLCKEVQCIETDDSSTKRYIESNYLPPEQRTGRSALVVVRNGGRRDQEWESPSLKEDGELLRLPLKEGRELRSPPLKEDGKVVSSPLEEDRELMPRPLKEDRELSCMHPFRVPSPENPSPWHDMTNLSSTRSLKLTKSRSCKASLMTSLSSSWFEKVEDSDNTPPNGFEKDFTGRPEGFQRKVSTLHYCFADVEKLARKASQSSLGSDVDIELEANDRRTSTDQYITNVNTDGAEIKEMAELSGDNQVADIPVKDNEVKANESLKNVKDVGLDPIEDFKSLSNWSFEFKKLQREIIELWHACNVSLVHRTYFFLLFKGDPTDSIYMEVELRRLLFLKDTFSRGNQTLENGWTLTPASSMKALRRERHMLSKQMPKRFSEQDRESLYLKWNIRLNTTHRRLQLAYRLWTSTEDMDHIADSAVLVSKLIGFVDPGHAPKEMFGLNFNPRRTTRSFSLKQSLISLL